MRIALALLLALCALPCALAQQPAAAPSDDSLRQLFETTHVTRILDAYVANVDLGMQAGLKAALAGHPPNAKQQKIIDDMRAEILKTLRDTLNWQKLEPIFLDIYRRNFTQQEVNDMLAFYRSPTGRSVIDKLPAAMQQAGKAVEGMVPALGQRLQQIEMDAAARLKAARDD